MFTNMKGYLSSETCLSCEGCCRFDKEKSDWRAKVGESEKNPILKMLSPEEKTIAPDIFQNNGYLKDKLCHGVYACVFFNPEDTTCGIYKNRPFECRLYPFVLTLWEGRPAVCVHLPCPYIQKTKGSYAYIQYVSYLSEYLQQDDVLTFLKSNPNLFGDYIGYEHELEWILDIK